MIFLVKLQSLTYELVDKVRGAEEECRAQGIAFLPIVAESLGGWHNGAEREVKKLGHLAPVG